MNSKEKSAVVNTVTKPKHPGRVAQGYKLVALMKDRKKELEQSTKVVSEQDTVLSSEQDTVLSPEQDTVLSSEQDTVLSPEQSNHSWMYSGMGAFFLVGGIMLYFYTNQKQTPVKILKKKRGYMD